MKRNSLTAFMMILCLLLGITVPFGSCAKEAPEMIHLSTESDLMAFAEHCRSDEWSAGKIVVLDNDIEIKHNKKLIIASFGGNFDGKGHSIRNITISEAGANTGFFGIVLKNGVVSNLTIEGDFTPKDVMSRLGGIAGSNYGRIENCNFQGTIKADREIGGIVGHNMTDGIISACESDGKIDGNQYCGGIAGYNEGRITNCVNRSSVNTRFKDTSLTKEELTDTVESLLMGESLNAIRSLHTRMDVGGVVGFSGSEVYSCVNHGTIGYEHVGYNNGGIVGRSTGFVKGCFNKGDVYGRKDVGGIIGQQQPFVVLDYNEGDLGELNAQVKTLGDKINTTLTHASGYSAETTQRLLGISALADSAADQIHNMSDLASSGVDDLTGAAQGGVDAAKVGVEDTNNYIDQVLAALDELDEAVEEQGDEAELSKDEISSIHQSIEDLRNALNATKSIVIPGISLPDINVPNVNVPNVNVPGTNLPGVNAQDQKSIKEKAEAARSRITSDTVISYPDVQRMLTSLNAALGVADSLILKLDELDTEEIKDSKEDLKDALHSNEQLYKDAKEILNSGNEFNSQVSDLNRQLQNSGTNLYATVGRMTDEIDQTVTEVNGNVQGSISDLKDLQAQGDQIRKKIDSMLKDAMNPDTYSKERREDISAENVEGATDGRTTECTNEGFVTADTHVGGITGGMGFEIDLDPESDVEKNGQPSFRYVLKTKCIVDRSINRQMVRCARNIGGGIVGFMELGLVINCQSYGDVEVEGDYAGGIGGFSMGEIADCYEKQYVSAARYTGGIVGYGTMVHGCRAMPNMKEVDQYIGAIAGNVEELTRESIYDNRYYARHMFGIDGVSYRGIAEGVSYHTLVGQAEVPPEFQLLKLVFEADDEIVDTITCHYKDSLDQNQIPKVPQKKGFFGDWKKKDFSEITADELIEAKYERIETLIQSDAVRGNKRPLLMAIGKFRIGSGITVKEKKADLAFEKGRWQVSIPDDGEKNHTFRYLPSKKDQTVHIYLFDGQNYRRIKSGRMGNYVTFQVTGNTFIFGAVEYWKNLLRMAVLIVALMAIAGSILFVIRFKQGKVLLQRFIRWIKNKVQMRSDQNPEN